MKYFLVYVILPSTPQERSEKGAALELFGRVSGALKAETGCLGKSRKFRVSGLGFKGLGFRI